MSEGASRLACQKLTLFAIPKAFRGEFDRIQRNAIASWTLLNPQPEIILLGDDEGTAEAAQEFGAKHIPDIQRNEYGTPLMNSMYEAAQSVGSGSLFVYVNSDIILTSDFIQTIQKIPFRRFMLTGQRWNLDFEEMLKPEEDWELKLRDHVAQFGQLEGPQAMDYFVFTRDTYTEVPPFAIGRLCFDNWMLYKALSLNIPLIDATGAITAIHQNHTYNHHPKGQEWIFSGPESKRNLQLLGGIHHTYFMLDLAGWQMTPHQTLKRAPWSWHRFERLLDMLPLARPNLKPTFQILLDAFRFVKQLKELPPKFKKIPARIVSKLR